MSEIKNAKITATDLTMRDHGVLTFYLTLEGDGWGCCFGGYVIGNGYLGAKEFSSESGSGLVAMMKIMDTVGVDTWEELKGKYCRVETGGWGRTIDKIGNLLTEKWFDIKSFFKEVQEAKG